MIRQTRLAALIAASLVAVSAPAAIPSLASAKHHKHCVKFKTYHKGSKHYTRCAKYK